MINVSIKFSSLVRRQKKKKKKEKRKNAVAFPT